MKLNWITRIATGVALVSLAPLWGRAVELQDRLYDVIGQRNAFGLKPIPPPPDPNANISAPPQLPPLNLKFTGITTMGGVKKAYFMIPDTAKPGTFFYPCLREGERDGALEVLEIDPKTDSVKIKNADRILVVDFKTYGNNNPVPGAPIPGPQMPGAPGRPGMPNVPGMPGAMGGQMPGAMGGQMPGAMGGQMPGAMGRQMPGAPGVPTQQSTGIQIPTTTSTTSQGRTVSFPARTVRGAAANLPQVPQHSVEESETKVIIQSEIAKPLVETGEMPPLPPVGN